MFNSKGNDYLVAIAQFEDGAIYILDGEDFAQAYCELFNTINLWLVTDKSSKSSTNCAYVSENLDANKYLAFLRPEHAVWENNIRRSVQPKNWIRKYHVKTYADFLRQM